MNILRTIGVICVLISVFSINAIAVSTENPSDSFGNAVFDAPRGWRRVESDGTLFFIPSDLRGGGRVLIAVLPGEELRGDFRQWFEATIEQSLQNGERIVRAGELKAQRAAEGYDTLLKIVETRDQTGYSYNRLYLAAHPGNRAEMVLYLASSADLFQQYSGVFEKFVTSLDYANSRLARKAPEAPAKVPDAPTRKPATGEQLSGLYTGNEYRRQFNVMTKYYDNINVKIHYIFWPDGRVYSGLPKGGTLERFDMDRAEREDAANVGRYSISGGQIRFTWTSGQRDPVAFQRASDSITLGKTTLYRVKTWDGLRLDGTYSVRSFTNLSGGVAEGGVSGEDILLLRKDGTFQSSGFTGYATSGSHVGAGTSSKTSGRGTYRITGNVLELRYANGNVVRATFYVHPENERQARPGLIVIDGAYYLLRD